MGMAFVADDEAAEAVEPGDGTLDDPSVSPEFLAALDAAPCDAGGDTSISYGGAAAWKVVSLVGMKLVRPAARGPALLAHGCQRIEQRLKGFAVVKVGAGQEESEGQSVAIDENVAFGAGFPAINRVWPGFLAPFFAGTDEESALARDQSMAAAMLSLFSIRRCRAAHTPAFCQSRSRRQQVMPEQPANSRGRYSHGMPVISTNMMPRNASRAATGGRPPLGRGRSGGISATISASKSSGSSSLAMSQDRPNMVNKWFC